VALFILLIIFFTSFTYPENQLIIHGFDPNLIEIHKKGTGAIVSANYDYLNLTTFPNTRAFVTIITTPTSFTFEIDAKVIEQMGPCLPLQISIWEPKTMSAFGIWFSSPQSTMHFGVQSGHLKWDVTKPVTRYTVGNTYYFRVSYVRGSSVLFTISNSTWSYNYKIENASVLYQSEVSLSLSSDAQACSGFSKTLFNNFIFTLPTQYYYSHFISNHNFYYAIYSVIFSAIAIFYLKDIYNLMKCIVRFFRKTLFCWINHNKREMLILFVIFVSSFCLQVALFPVGGHKYDIFVQGLASYILTHYGFHHLYPLSLITPSGRVNSELPFISGSYTYPPLPSYILFLVGTISKLTCSTFEIDGFYLEYLIKFVWTIFVNVNGFLIYIFMRKNKLSFCVSVLLLLSYVLNPGVLLDSSIWGQLDSFLTFLFLMMILTLDSNRPTLSWIFMSLALLTKQTAVVPVLFTALLLLKNFGFHKFIMGISVAVTTSFIFLVPFLFSKYSPFFFFNLTLGERILNVIRPDPTQFLNPDVSIFAFNIWPIIIQKMYSQSSLYRFFTPDSLLTPIRVRLVTLGAILFLMVFVSVIILIIILERIKHCKISQFYIFFLIVFALYLLPTRMHERHFYFVIPFLIMSYLWIKDKKFFRISFILLSFTFSVSLYLSLIQSAIWVPEFNFLFHPSNNYISQLFYQTFLSDLGITFLCTLNILFFALSLIYIFIRCSKIIIRCSIKIKSIKIF